eukprot:CAMPEP_0171091698 /NCGR_PEP_ID=MMETSP0766_2-20121228/34910_1 /TAXON_ID=439317 /ORGANISM="Gambierdiscus australes, Strain CAWD 149" /LENGTH=197 /DNA_ID=CAMNT_0011549847 /DNA_START=38 /DNA_END=631 /DNA_ORIENTATION=+
MSQTGKVKFFNAVKGYGFLRQDSKEPDVFIHRESIADGCSLLAGDQVSYDTEFDDEQGKLKATNVRGGSGGPGLTFASAVNRAPVVGKTGTVLRYFCEKDFGFIKQDDGGADLYVHRSALLACEGISQGLAVTFDVVWDDTAGKQKAANVARREVPSRGLIGALEPALADTASAAGSGVSAVLVDVDLSDAGWVLEG